MATSQWLAWAALSAVFAALTAIFAKVGVDLNRAVSRQPLREREREPMAAPRPPMRVIRNATTGAVDYIDVPERAPARAAAPEARPAETPSDYLDIPAFLRRQAD